MHDVNKYYGDNKPEWEPTHTANRSLVAINYGSDARYDNFLNYVVIDDMVHPWICDSLIEQFEDRETYPVGVSGYCDDTAIGSYRTMAWAPDLARRLRGAFTPLPKFFRGNGPDLVNYSTTNMQRIPAPFNTVDHTYDILGPTPWMRFMKYVDGGKHVPHYDAPFWCEPEKYVTLFSWVLYLNDANYGGRLQFVDDRYTAHPQYRKEGWDADWTHQAPERSVISSVQPKRGTLVIFPHWLCHQVEQFTGDIRYIIRGDVAYGY